MTFSVVGGDLRQIALASSLEKDGYDVKIFGFDKDIETNELKKAADLDEALLSEVIILPLPMFGDEKSVNTPFYKKSINAEELLGKIKRDSLVFGGKIPDVIYEKYIDLKIYDYLKREEFAIANAIPTAEGAIEIAISETPHTLHDNNMLVVGYGRIGKILADRLAGFGARVDISARKCTDFSWIEAQGFSPKEYENLDIGKYKIIFNTVPALVLDEEMLKKLDKNALIIDLASKPGGVDFEIAKKLGIKVIWAQSLPGKVAPITSGEIIKKTVINILKEKEGFF